MWPPLIVDTGVECERDTDSRNLLEDEFSVVSVVGQGTTSYVQHAVRRSDSCHVALKTLRVEDEHMISVAKEEYEMLRTIAHPNIVRALDFIAAPCRAVLVLEFFNGRDLLQTVSSMPEQCLPEIVAMPLTTMLADAVVYLHSRRVTHRDIKPQNVLASSDLKHLKLVDFNVARNLQEGLALTPTGTRLYAAPEVIFGEPPSELSDIWAVGLCAHLLLSGKLPQGREGCDSLKETIQVCAKREVTLQGHPWTKVSTQCKSVLRRCLAAEPSKRLLSMAALLQGCSAWVSAGCCGTRSRSMPSPEVVSRHAAHCLPKKRCLSRSYHSIKAL